MAEQEAVSIQPTLRKLQERFEQYANTSSRLIDGVKKTAREEIHILQKDQPNKPYQITEELINNTESSFQSLGIDAVKDFLSTEKTVQRWLVKNNDSYSNTIAQAFNLEISAEKIRRIVGGFAILITPVEFSKRLVDKFYINGKEVKDQHVINQRLSEIPEAGFLLEDSELTEKVGLPKGTQIAFILDSGTNKEGIERAIGHEEDEIVGKVVDELTKTNIVHRLDTLAYQNEAIRPITQTEYFKNRCVPALHDISARLKERGLIDLASLGFSPEDLQEHPQEIQLIKTVLDGTKRKIVNPEDFDTMAAYVQGAILRPENLIDVLYSTDNNRINPAEEIKVHTPEDSDFDGVAIKSETKGRFVYNDLTLKGGDKVSLNLIDYIVDQPLGKGGFGAVYKAHTKDGSSFVIKEVIMPAVQALFADESTAEAFINSLIIGRGPDLIPALVIGDLMKVIKPEPRSEHEAQHQFAQEYVSYLDKSIRDIFVNEKNRSGLPFYDGNVNGILRFNYDLDPSGRPIIDKNTTDKILSALREVVIRFPSLETPEAKKYGLSEEFYPENLRKQLDEKLEMFSAESETLYRVQGIPRVVSSYGVARSGVYKPSNPQYDCYYMIQDYAEGEDLDKYLMTHNLDLSQIVEISSLLLETLAGIHERGVIHKDIKPGNIKINSKGEPVLFDFGIAKSRLNELTQAQTSGARSGTSMMGTPGYNSPEHFLGKTDQRSDIFSMGLLLYEMVTGESVEGILSQYGSLNVDLKRKHMEKILDSKDNFGSPKFPFLIKEIVLKATEEDKNARYQNATEMVNALKSMEISTEDQYTRALISKLSARNFDILAKSTYSGLSERGEWWETGNSWDDSRSELRLFGLPKEYEEAFQGLVQIIISQPGKINIYLDQVKKIRDHDWPTPVKESIRKGVPYLVLNIIKEVSLKYGPQILNQALMDNVDSVVVKKPSILSNNSIGKWLSFVSENYDIFINNPPLLESAIRLSTDLLEVRNFDILAKSTYSGLSEKGEWWETGNSWKDSRGEVRLFGLPKEYEEFFVMINRLINDKRNPIDPIILLNKLKAIPWPGPTKGSVEKGLEKIEKDYKEGKKTIIP